MLDFQHKKLSQVLVAMRLMTSSHLYAVASFGFLSYNIHNGVNQLGPFSVVSLGPVVARSALAEDEVVRSEDLTEGSWSHRVHGSGLEVDEHGSGDVLPAGGLIEVDVDSL